jgi:hypothetical protein
VRASPGLSLQQLLDASVAIATVPQLLRGPHAAASVAWSYKPSSQGPTRLRRLRGMTHVSDDIDPPVQTPKKIYRG